MSLFRVRPPNVNKDNHSNKLGEVHHRQRPPQNPCHSSSNKNKSPPAIPYTNRGHPSPPGVNAKILNIATLTLSKDEEEDVASPTPPASVFLNLNAAFAAPQAPHAVLPTRQQQEPPVPPSSYHLHRQHVIGRGSYGQVCIATRTVAPSSPLPHPPPPQQQQQQQQQHVARRKFAAKCVALRPSDTKQLSKLEEEVSILRQANGHPFIIRLVDVLCSPSEVLIVTELGRGGDLFHLLTMHPR